MASTINRQDDGTIVLTIQIPADHVTKAREEVMADLMQHAKIEGFRPGKAPRKLVEENMNATQFNEEILKKVLPQAYTQAVEEHKLRPIMNPKVHIGKLEDGKEWEFSATTAEMPEIKLNDYKKQVRDITAKAKIVIPGKDLAEPNFDELIKVILNTVEMKIPQILIGAEVDRLLAQTLDEIKKLGISLEQYLSSTGKTTEILRDEYKEKATQDIKLEFVLQKIAEEEKITVEGKEIEEAIQKAKDPKEKQNLEANRYLLASILRQQKTLDFIKSL